MEEWSDSGEQREVGEDSEEVEHAGSSTEDEVGEEGTGHRVETWGRKAESGEGVSGWHRSSRRCPPRDSES